MLGGYHFEPGLESGLEPGLEPGLFMTRPPQVKIDL